MRKVDRGERDIKGDQIENRNYIGHHVVTSQPPNYAPTRANYFNCTPIWQCMQIYQVLALISYLD